MKTRWLLWLMGLTPWLVFGAEKDLDPKKSHRSWEIYHGDYGGSHYSSLDQIHRSNVHQLEPVWVWHSGDIGSTIECNPIIVGDTMFVTTPRLHCVALNAVTGKPRWRFDPWQGGRGGGVSRGVAYWSDGQGDERVFFSAGDHLYALDAKTGQLAIEFGTQGRISHRDGFDTDVFFFSIGNNTPPMIWKDLLILGSTTGEGPQPCAPGHIRAFDARTGERRWIFHTIPHPGEFGYETWGPDSWKEVGSANVWGGFTLDAERGILFCGTGSPAYDSWGGNRPGANLFGNCTLALDAMTGKRLWHFQAVHHDLWDYDLPTPPVLGSMKVEGKQVEVVVQPTKMGHLFVLNRETGRPMFPVEEKSVPASKMPGESSWPTQPFPSPGLRLSPTTLNAEQATRLTPKAHQQVLGELESMVVGDVFIPPGYERSVVLPQFNGGCEWGGAAFDPNSNTVLVNTSNEAEWTSMVASKPKEEMSLFELGRHVYRAVCAFCHGLGTPQNPASPSLEGIGDRLSEEQIASLMETGRGQMPSFASFSALEKQAVTQFLLGKGKSERIPTKDLNLSYAENVPVVTTGHHDWRDPQGYPVNSRPWGTLNAVDLTTGQIKWQVALGTYPSLEKKGHSPTGTFNIGGPVVTGGGLVFIGAAMDERFHAYDVATGALLWEYQMEFGGYATPATYEVEGRQFVVIAAGGGGKPGTKKGDAYYCFALPNP